MLSEMVSVLTFGTEDLRRQWFHQWEATFFRASGLMKAWPSWVVSV